MQFFFFDGKIDFYPFFFRVVKDDLARMGRQALQERGYAIRYLDSVNSRMTGIILTQTTVCSTVACEQASGEDGKKISWGKL